ncbi:integrase family protein [Alicycliphilus sp. B1]|nr:integrase family protein [Alicycliphilus sp. B1]
MRTQKRGCTQQYNPFDSFGRSGGIRTRDPLLPKQMRYQAALRSDGRNSNLPNNTARANGALFVPLSGCPKMCPAPGRGRQDGGR